MLIAIVLGGVLVAALGLAMAAVRHRPLFYWQEDVWSIALLRGPDPESLLAGSALPGDPAITGRDVTDVAADFVADPFLFRHAGEWCLFFEIFNSRRRLGELAVARSLDGLTWTYGGIVLREAFHLSYPLVFSFAGEHYLVAETGEAGAVLLYRATDFPRGWRCERTLLSGHYLDPTIFEWQGRWWMFALRDQRDLTLHGAATPLGPWREHPMSPLIRGDNRVTRPSGRVVAVDGQLFRFAQDCGPTYGHAVRAFRILELTPETYREVECDRSPILGPGEYSWNRHGMHHFDLHELSGGGWIAAVDGKTIRSRFDLKLGLRRLPRAVLGGSR